GRWSWRGPRMARTRPPTSGVICKAARMPMPPASTTASGRGVSLSTHSRSGRHRAKQGRRAVAFATADPVGQLDGSGEGRFEVEGHWPCLIAGEFDRTQRWLEKLA